LNLQTTCFIRVGAGRTCTADSPCTDRNIQMDEPVNVEID
jgi:hypothetical protein